MSKVLKISGPIRVGSLASDPASPEVGLIYFNTTAGKYKLYNGVTFETITDTEVIGTLVQGTNYTASNVDEISSHLQAIDSALATSGGTEFSDSDFRIQDNGDATKEIAFEASAILTGTTRTITMPNANVNLGDISTNASAISTNSGNISANTSDIADLRTTQGTVDGDTHLGTFTGTTIADSSSVKGALQSLETAHESTESSVTSHLNGGASKHDANEVDYERVDGSKKNISAASDDVESALTNLDDAIGTLSASPTNYTPASPTIVASHLTAIDSALATAGANEKSDSVFRITDNGDSTKKIAFEASTIATGTTRTITMPNANVDLGALANTTLSNLGTTNISANLIPSSSNSVDLGDATKNWRTVAARRLDVYNSSNVQRGRIVDTATLPSTGANNQGTNLFTLAQAAGGFNTAIFTDSESTANANATGNVNIETGNKTAGTGASGNINLKTGTSAGGSKGNIKLDALNVDFSATRATNAANPTSAQDLATKSYVDAVAAGLTIKKNVRVASTANLNLSSAPAAIDGITLTSGDRVLVKNQSTTTQNGIYDFNGSGSAMTRSSDFDNSPEGEVYHGTFIPKIIQGTVNAGLPFVLISQGTGVAGLHTLGSDALTWEEFTSPSQLTAGNGITISGNSVSVKHDGEGLIFSGSDLALELDGSTLSKSASGVRVAAQTASRALVSDGSGNLSSSATTSTEIGYVSGVTSAIQTQINSKIASVSDDTAPSLGGNLTLGSNVVIHDADGMKRGTSASNFIEEEYIHAITLAASQTDTVISALTFAHASYEGMEITYKIKEATSNDVRIGTVRVVTNGSTVALNDVYTETADTGIVFDAVINGANVEINFDSGANVCTMRADVKRIKA